MATPVDEYLAREMALNFRIAETENSIAHYKARKGMARHRATKRIRELRKQLVMLKDLKEVDSLPWEPGPTLEMDALATSMLSKLT